jgi:hypothetical protein
VATLVACTGFGFGTTAGWATGNAGNKIFDAVVGTPTITTSTPRTGTYCLEISASAATEGVRWTTDTLGTSKTHLVMVGYVYFPTSLPGADFDLMQLQCVGPNYIVVFRASDSKICVGIPGGSLTAGPVVTTNTWYRIDVHMDLSANPHTIDWRIDGTVQAQFSNASAADTVAAADLGPTLAAQTGTIRCADWAVSVTSGDYPLGGTKVVLLKPDTGGSLDVATINTAEWNTFAGATPTLSAWNATTALGAIDEIPVGLGASADGFCRITGTDADYVGIPMTTYTLGAGESIAGVRMLACCWAQSGTACTHSFASYNGTTATTLLAAADIGTDNSSTAPAWVCKMCTLADVDTQTELDALQFRFGVTDSTPDAGIHALYAEVAVFEAVSGDATATPAVIATTTAMTRAAVNVAAAPAVLSTSSAAPAATVNVAAVPAVLSTVAALPQPAVNVVAAPAALATAVTLPTATPVIESGDATATPAVLATVVTLPSVAVNVAAAPAVLPTTVSLPTPAVDVAAAPAVIPTTTGLDRPAVNVAAAPAVLSSVTALPGVAVDVGVLATVIPTVASLPTPTIVIPGAATANPDPIATTVALPAPVVHVAAAPAVLETSVALPPAEVGVTVSPVTIETLVAFYAPTVPFTIVMGPGNVHGPLPLSPGSAGPDPADALAGARSANRAGVGAASGPSSAALAGGVT